MATTNRLAVSFSNRSVTSYDKQLDKITSKELNETLNEKIDISYAHLQDDVKHITAEERNRWNTIMSNIKPATEGVAGLMSAEDKIKLNGIANFATNYRHPDSGVIAGAYTRVTVNSQGHVIFGENPSRLNINVDNAEKLGGNLPSYYAKADSPTFTGVVKVPDVTIAGNPNSPVTVKLLEDYVAKQILNKAHPIGSIYLTFSTLDPATILGGGEWRKISTGRMLISSGADYPLRSTGGERDHILTQSEIPMHTHRIWNTNIPVDTSAMMQDHYHATGTTENNNGVNITRPNKEKIHVDAPPDFKLTGWNGSNGGNDAWDIPSDQKYNTFTSRAVPINGRSINAGSASIRLDFDSQTTGGGVAHNNLPPYISVNMWERIA